MSVKSDETEKKLVCYNGPIVNGKLDVPSSWALPPSHSPFLLVHELSSQATFSIPYNAPATWESSFSASFP